jgi:hypothetical protein
MDVLAIIEAIDSDEPISIENRDIVISLLKEIQVKNSTVLQDCITGSDGMDGVSIRWPDFNLFCDVTEGVIYISTVSLLTQNLEDIKFSIYSHTQIKKAVSDIFIRMNLVY